MIDLGTNPQEWVGREVWYTDDHSFFKVKIAEIRCNELVFDKEHYLYPLDTLYSTKNECLVALKKTLKERIDRDIRELTRIQNEEREEQTNEEKTKQATIKEWSRMGGIARAKKLSPQKRKEIAIKAINTRWSKKRQIEQSALKKVWDNKEEDKAWENL